MKKKKLFFSALLTLMSVGMASADDAKIYVSVNQGESQVTAVGTAAFTIGTGQASVVYVNGERVMHYGGRKVAVLPAAESGSTSELVVTFSGTESNVSKTVSNDYATVYSPFQLKVPATNDVEVYAPTYSEGYLHLNSDTKVAAGAVIPAGTGLLLKNNGTINFTFSAGLATYTHTSALSGSALTIANPTKNGAVEGKTVYTFGHKTEGATTDYGFYAYTGDNLNPGLAYLYTETVVAGNAREYVGFDLGDGETTGITNANVNPNANREGKFIENGRIVIVKNGRKYNLNGQEVK